MGKVWTGAWDWKVLKFHHQPRIASCTMNTKKREKILFFVVWVACFKCERVFLAVAAGSFEVIAILCFSSETDIQIGFCFCVLSWPLCTFSFVCFKGAVYWHSCSQYNGVWSIEENILLVEVWWFYIQFRQSNTIMALAAKYTKYDSSSSDSTRYVVFTFVYISHFD